MILLVIGLDKTGKSSMIEGVRQKTHWTIMKYCQQPDNYAAVLTCLAGLRAADNFVNMIFDRFPHPDDIIYSPVIEGADITDNIVEAHKNVDELLVKHNCHILYCYAEPEVIARRLAEAKGIDIDDYVMPEHINELIKRYEDFLSSTKIPVTRLNSGALSIDQMIEAAMTIVQWKEDKR